MQIDMSSDDRLLAVPTPLLALGTAVIYAALSYYVLWLNDPVNAGAGFWPGAGVTLAALLLVPTGQWRWVLAGVGVAEFGVDIANGYPVVATCWWAAGNVIEPLVAALLLRRFGRGGRLTPVPNLALFLGCGVVLAPLIGSTVGSIGTVTEYSRSWTGVWPKYWIGDGLGVLVVAPAILSFWEKGLRGRPRPESAALAVLVVAATVMAFRNWGTDWDLVLPFVILPLVIWAALRFGIRATALVGFVVAQGANLATALGHGPFAASVEAGFAVTLLQVFLVIALATGLIVAALVSDLAERDEVQYLLEHQAAHDQLTGLPNRGLLMERLDAALAQSERSGQPVGVLFIDLDRFKVINDSLGHHAGDAILVEVGRRLAGACRPLDTVARFGGDEFVIVCPDLDDETEAGEVARRLLQVASVPIEHGAMSMTVGASIGVVVASGRGVPAGALVRDADTAMYRAKTAGRQRFEFFEDRLRAEAVERWQLDVDLGQALERGELELHYQPIVSLSAGRVVAFEALLRWRHPTRGLLLPAAFLPIAEETGLIRPIGEWVVGTAVDQLAAWEWPDVSLSLNISPVQMDGRPGDHRDLAELVAAACRRAGVDPARLWLEVTESVLLPDAPGVEPLRRLHDDGVHLAVDDFGTGYGSLTRVRTLPFDVLKIDKSFVAEITGEEPDAAVVDSVINLAHALGMSAVAEGVETEAQSHALRALGCDLAQGYHFGYPACAADITDRYAAAGGELLRFG